MINAAVALLLSIFWPTPRMVVPKPDVVLKLPLQVAAPAELAKPAALLRRELRRIFGPRAVTASGKTVVRLVRLSRTGSVSRPEEYVLDATGGTMTLAAAEEQGAFWAVQSLVQLLGSHALRRTPTGYAAPGVHLLDWPESAFRAFMIQGAWTPSVADFRRNLDVLARMKIKYFALEFGPQVVLDLDPAIAQGGRFTKAQAKALIDYGRSLGMQPIAYLNMLGHLDRAYQKPPYTDHGGIMIQNEETYERFVYPVLSEMLDVYGPVEYFHCGMDEAWELFTWFSQQGMKSADLVAQHVEKVNRFLKARGVKLVIWHDMFFDPGLANELGAPVGPANGGPPQNTAAALDRIPRDVVLDYWFYEAHAAYPGLEYLSSRGFPVWASPWQTPFSFTRYAQARSVPVMGTLWSGPPGCWYSPTYNPVTALYAQAAWNPAAAPGAPGTGPALRAPAPEQRIRDAAERATDAELWARRSAGFPTATAMLLNPGEPGKARRLAWPAEAREAGEQHYGVPLNFASPALRPSVPARRQALADTSSAASVLLRGSEKLALDGANSRRDTNQLILYGAPRTTTGTNRYGAEVGISATGEVLDIAPDGPGDMAIPPGGFVLSAHGQKMSRLLALSRGDRVGVFDAAGNWLGGYEPAMFKTELPGGVTIAIDGADRARGPSDVNLYGPGYEKGQTGTDASGTEVILRNGKVLEVRSGAGNAPIPSDGFVLSAGASAPGREALARLQTGDTVRLLVSKGGQARELGQALAGARWSTPIGAACREIYLALAAESTAVPGTYLGKAVVSYRDGSHEGREVRFDYEALALEGREPPRRMDGTTWIVERPEEPGRCLVWQWKLAKPGTPVVSLSFQPAPAALEVGYRVLAVTCAVTSPHPASNRNASRR